MIFVLLLSLVSLTSVLAADPIAPDTFAVTFTTDVKAPLNCTGSSCTSSFVINCKRKSAPLGVDRFYALVKDGFYNNAAFFRVVPKFVAQFGIAGSPAENTKWNQTIQDDPVLGSNTVGTVTFATSGPNTRTTQLFINTADNARLDKMGFAPFATLNDGLDIVTDIDDPTPGDSNGIDQDQYATKGNKWLKKEYPKANFILSATIKSIQ